MKAEKEGGISVENQNAIITDFIIRIVCIVVVVIIINILYLV